MSSGANEKFNADQLALLDDNPAVLDLLGIDAIVNSVANALGINELDPLTVGINSPWGGGKTTTLGLIEHHLAGKDEYVVIRTNPWEYDDHGDVKSLLISEIIDSLQERFKETAEFESKAKDLLKRISWSRVSAMVAKGLITVQWSPKEIVDAFTPKPRTNPDSMTGFRDSFAELLDMLPTTKRVIILVDDLDRCLPDAVMSTLEAIKLFLSVKKMAFVLAADQVMVRDAIAASLHASGRSEVFANRYLEKIVQLPVSLPRLNPDAASNYIALLFCGMVAPDQGAFDALVAHCRTRRTAGESNLFGDMSKLIWRPDDSLLQFAERIANGLSSEKSTNPRYIKRFLNALGVRMQVASANGVIIKPEIIAKLYLLEDRFPKEFEYLLSLPKSDRDKFITDWEKWACDVKDAKKPDNVSEESKEWAASQPSIRDMTIDRYLLLAAAFGGASASTSLNDAQQSVALNLVSDSEAIRQEAVSAFEKLSTDDQVVVIETSFGMARRLDDVSPLLRSAIEIAKSHQEHVRRIVEGIHEYCWQRITPASALEIILSEVAEIIEIGAELEADGTVADDVKVSVRQAREAK